MLLFLFITISLFLIGARLAMGVSLLLFILIVLKTKVLNKKAEEASTWRPKKGGQVTIGGVKYTVDRFDTDGGLMFLKKMAMGGYISGAGNGTSDSIPAMLSNGEYVVSAKAVQAAGIPMLDRINKMAMGGPVYNVPAYSTGGRVKYNNGGMATSSNSLYNINVTLNGTDMSPDDVANAIERKMRLREATMGRGRSN
jgi:hypothetical protein